MIEKAIGLVGDLIKHLITLSTGILALTITVWKDFANQQAANAKIWAVYAWIAFAISVVVGTWAMMALTGSVSRAANSGATSVDVYSSNIRVPVFLQILSFLVGLGLAITFGVKAK
jgi:hypothetical protein